jgi:hypothetical protein
MVDARDTIKEELLGKIMAARTERLDQTLLVKAVRAPTKSNAAKMSMLHEMYENAQRNKELATTIVLQPRNIGRRRVVPPQSAPTAPPTVFISNHGSSPPLSPRREITRPHVQTRSIPALGLPTSIPRPSKEEVAPHASAAPVADAPPPVKRALWEPLHHTALDELYEKVCIISSLSLLFIKTIEHTTHSCSDTRRRNGRAACAQWLGLQPPSSCGPQHRCVSGSRSQHCQPHPLETTFSQHNNNMHTST